MLPFVPVSRSRPGLRRVAGAIRKSQRQLIPPPLHRGIGKLWKKLHKLIPPLAIVAANVRGFPLI